MRTAPGFTARLYAHEPEIRQPVTMTFDQRGRLWVIQYLQYPNPSGLKPVRVDQYLRTQYDRVPEPPPQGPKGEDRITICEDTNGDGRADLFKDFVSGLNLASGMAIGHGGLFVVQPPYLLFYPDANHDDVPDRDPEVLLTGFGMEDSHAFANSLQWGPDGWLYGAHGSTVTARIRGIEFQQGIWRYHPLTRDFELFAEGGGNTWGVDFDEDGNLIAGTNWGGQIALHQVQGAYYVKGFAKHGPLHNPFAFGYFEHIPYRGFRGGHVTCGGIVYQGAAFPAEFHGVYIAANLLANGVFWHRLEPEGSSFRGRFGGVLLETDDVTFRPIDCLSGPDGSVFVADWCDKRASHVDPLNTWDRSNGRIFKIEPVHLKPIEKFDLGQKSSSDLVQLLGHPNNWFRREARRLLAERRDPTLAPALEKQSFQSANPSHALESLWALYVSGGWNDARAEKFLRHPFPAARSWTVRWLGDARRLDPSLQKTLVQLARTEPNSSVRNQLACTAKRLPSSAALPLIRVLLERDEDTTDPQIPLLLWWAIEAKAIAETRPVLGWFSDSTFWESPLVRQHMIERLARRYTLERSPAAFQAAADLLDRAPNPAAAELAMKGIELGLAGRRFKTVPAPFVPWLARVWPGQSSNLIVLRLALRLGSADALRAGLERLASTQVTEDDRIALAETIGQSGRPEAAPQLLDLFEAGLPPKLALATLSALENFAEPGIASRLLQRYDRLDPPIQNRVRSLLATRPASSRLLVKAVEDKTIPATDFSLDQVRQMALLKDVELTRRTEKIWGKIRPESDEDKKNAVNELRLVLRPSGTVGRQATGEPQAGRQIFQQICGACHKLFGEGGAAGPDLTGADRKNTDYLLTHIVDPSAYIRPEYVSYEVTTTDERVLSGLLVDSGVAEVALLDANQQRHVIARDQIRGLKESSVSLMPEGLLQALSPQQLQDLFSYLQSEGPSP